MFLVLAATATTTVVIALGLIRRLFTPDHRRVYLPVPPITETAAVSAAAATVVQGL
jgi:putative ABC transport system permease protein